MKIIIEVKTVYGNDLIYPVCDTSKLFAALTKTKTLSPSDITKIKQLGYSIEIAQNNKLGAIYQSIKAF